MAIVAACVAALAGIPANAHRHPENCNVSGVTLLLTRSPASVIIGETVQYAVAATNIDDPSIGTIACDADDIDVVFYCPGRDGEPDFDAPIVLTTDLNLPGGSLAQLIGVVPCTLNPARGIFDLTAQVRLGDRALAIDNPSEGRVHVGSVDQPLRLEELIGAEVITTTTSTSTSSSTSNSIVTLTTSSTTTVSTTSTAAPSTSSTSTTSSTMPPVCGNGMREGPEQCDPADAADRECCSLDPDDPCTVLQDKVGQPCGPERSLAVCEAHAACSSDGRCVPTPQPAFPATRCRRPFETDLCDLGDFCDGASTSCPITGLNQCIVTVPEPPPGATVIDVTCAAPKGKGGLDCFAVGREATTAALARAGAATDPLECTAQTVAKKLSATKEDAMDELFLQEHVRLKLNAKGRRRLQDQGALDICVLVKIRANGKTVAVEPRFVTLRSMP